MKSEKTSDWRYSKKITFNTLEEFMEFINETGEEIIIIPTGPSSIADEFPVLEIYDDYRE